jgi:hypothetical protein
MKNRTLRSRAVRGAVGGLLMSSLSEAELKRVAHELDFEFLSDLKEMLLALPFRPEIYQEDLYVRGSVPDVASAIYEKSKVRRLSKDRMLSFMSEVDKSAAASAAASASTLRQLVEEFVARVGPDGGARLLGRLSGQLEQDPYLEGISERK